MSFMIVNFFSNLLRRIVSFAVWVFWIELVVVAYVLIKYLFNKNKDKNLLKIEIITKVKNMFIYLGITELIFRLV